MTPFKWLNRMPKNMDQLTYDPEPIKPVSSIKIGERIFPITESRIPKDIEEQLSFYRNIVDVCRTEGVAGICRRCNLQWCNVCDDVDCESNTNEKLSAAMEGVINHVFDPPDDGTDN